MSAFDDLTGILENVREYFMTQMSRDAVNLWFGDLTVTDMDGEVLTLATSSEFKLNILQQKYLSKLEEQFSSLLGFDVRVQLKIAQKSEEKPAEKENAQSDFSSTVTNEYTFETFIEGSSNKFALAACTAVADHPATNYNPLFIYGPSGIGKTHLMYAITDRVRRNHPDVKIVFVKFEDFLNQFVDAVTNSKKDDFHKLYRECDILIIDDIQSIAGKVETEQEFFNIFNTLYEDKKQIILTSDRPPREMKTLADRLKTRFEWGVLADIQPPDLELRMAIIKKKAELFNISLSDDVLVYLAENLRSNIRQLEGAIKKLVADSFLNGTKITPQKAKECISDLLDGQIPLETLVNRVFSVSYNKYGIPRDDLTGKKRTQEIATARHATIYLMRNSIDISTTHIGTIFNRDHTTILASIEKIDNRLKNDRAFHLEMDAMIKEVKN